MNLRDIGGIATRAGETVATGRLFRSAAPPVEPTATAQLVAATGLRRVVDLRMDEEVEQTGPLVLPLGCEWIRSPLFEKLQPHWPEPTDRTPPSTAERYYEMLEAGLPTLAEIVEMLGDVATNPTLIHCVAGRDRTGIVIACVLDLLDVPDETIAADYALSSVVDDAEGRHASPDNIRLLLKLMRDRFGSGREMLHASGTESASIKRLQAALLQ